jgi:hypothetical protein
MQVRTTPINFGYQLRSPTITLRPGWYEAVMDGSIQSGGLELGILDPGRQACIGNGWFWFGQRGAGSAMAAVVHASARTKVQIVVVNWVPVIPESSSFLVRAVTIRRLPFLERPDVREFYRSQASSLATPAGLLDVAAGWSFANDLPRKWSIQNKGLTHVPGASRVRTLRSPFSYELVAPPLQLSPGAYTVLVNGRVDEGGLSIGMVDTTRNRFISQSLYWYGQRGFDRALMSASFAIASTTRVQIVLSNWAPEPFRSTWTLRSVTLRHRDQGP